MSADFYPATVAGFASAVDNLDGAKQQWRDCVAVDTPDLWRLERRCAKSGYTVARLKPKMRGSPGKFGTDSDTVVN